jgi:hypothetical protein
MAYRSGITPNLLSPFSKPFCDTEHLRNVYHQGYSRAFSVIPGARFGAGLGVSMRPLDVQFDEPGAPISALIDDRPPSSQIEQAKCLSEEFLNHMNHL